jgi:hypothetical protein
MLASSAVDPNPRAKTHLIVVGKKAKQLPTVVSFHLPSKAIQSLSSLAAYSYMPICGSEGPRKPGAK